LVRGNHPPTAGLEADRIVDAAGVQAHGRRPPEEKVMTELQSPQPKRYTAKAIFGLLLAVVMVAAFATAGTAENTGTPRIGWLHITKECHEFSGQAGGFCTITGSNLNAISPGTKVVYTNPSFAQGVLSSDLVVDGPGNNDAYGHVQLNLTTWLGPLFFSGGSGQLSGFHAAVLVNCKPAGSPCTWDGPYWFTSPGHDR
jgi:hypothetical protein